MTADDDDLCRKAAAVRAAVERMHAANSIEAGAAAMADAKAANDRLTQATGMRDLYRIDMMAQARGLPPGSKVDARDFPRFVRESLDDTPAARIRMLNALAQHAMHGTDVLSTSWAGRLAAQLLAYAKGRYGPLSPVWAAGVNRMGDPAENIRLKVVCDTGYTIGVMIGATGQIPDTFWPWAARWQNELASEARAADHDVSDLTASTIKGLCEKETREADLFQACRRDGAAAASAPDRLRMLPDTIMNELGQTQG